MVSAGHVSIVRSATPFGSRPKLADTALYTYYYYRYYYYYHRYCVANREDTRTYLCAYYTHTRAHISRIKRVHNGTYNERSLLFVAPRVRSATPFEWSSSAFRMSLGRRAQCDRFYYIIVAPVHVGSSTTAVRVITSDGARVNTYAFAVEKNK